MDENSCCLCGGNRWRSLTTLTTRSRSPFSGSIVQCRTCGLARFSPLPSKEDLQIYYSGPAYRQGFDDAGVSMVTESPDTRRDLEQRLATLEKMLGGPGRILDVGADIGTFLALARAREWSVDGLELGESVIATALERHGISLVRTTIEAAPFPAEAFDVVHASHVLEHVPDPLSFLQAARKLIKPGGIICIEVPHELGDLFTRFQEMVFRRQSEQYLVASPHLYFFSPSTLGQLLRKSGFLLERCTTPRRNKSLESRLPCGRPLKASLYFIEEQTKQGPLIEVFARNPGQGHPVKD